MKRLAVLFLIFLVSVLLGCDLDLADSTFDIVSQSYVEEYGRPEDMYEYQSISTYLVEWWWWTKGFQLTFSNWNSNATKQSNGWQVESTFTFSPF